MTSSNFPAGRLGALAVIGAVAATTVPQAAQADWVTLPNTGAPIVSCNPKNAAGNQSATLATCKVTGLPPAILTGYVQAAQVYTGTGASAVEGANITANGVVVGTRFDRVYCKGTVTGTIPNQTATCDYSQPLVIATRLKMLATPNNPARNPNCPVWDASPNNECFEINNVFRKIRGANPSGSTPANEVTTSIAYFMGTTNGAADPNTALAKKYLEYAGKTTKGLKQYTPPGLANYTNAATPGDRDASRVMFQSDTNVFDPDSLSSQWSPWLLQRQVCTGFVAPAATVYNIRLYEAGEEGQKPLSIQSGGFACSP